MADRTSILKRFLSSAAGVLLSRIFGLARVILEARVLGGGAAASSWFLASMIPNLLRRVLGEGALATSLIPLISHTESERGIGAVQRQLGMVFTVLGVLLALIVILVSGVALLIVPALSDGYVRDALRLLVLVMPYGFFICIVGVAGAILNTRGKFFLPSLGGVLLNLFLVACLLYFCCAGSFRIEQVLTTLAVATLAAGVVHLALMLYLLYRQGVFPYLGREMMAERKVLRELWGMTFFGFIAYSAIQLSFLSDRALAAWLGPQAVPALTFSDRIINLPTGVFGVCIGGVFMAEMSRAAAKNDGRGLMEHLVYALRIVAFCCVPMAAYIGVFRRPILELLFLGGRFSVGDLHEAAWAMLFYAGGIPFFCALKVIQPAFYARKDTRTPMFVTLGGLALNLVLNLILMWPLRQGGLALATVAGSILNNLALLWLLEHHGFSYDRRAVCIAWLRSAGASLAAVAAAWGAARLLAAHPLAEGRLELLWELLASGAVFGGCFLAISVLSGGRELQEFLTLFRRRKKSA